MSRSKLMELYMSDNIQNLNKQCAVKEKVSSIRMAIGALEKLFEAVEKADLDGDEERCYVLGMRYIEMYKQIKVRSDYKKNPASMINATKIMNLLTRCEQLALSLKHRYDEKSAIKLADKLSTTTTNFIPYVAEENSSIATATQLVIEDSFGSVNVHTLVNYMKEADKVPFSIDKQILLMDIRCSLEFNKSHIRSHYVLNFPETSIEPGFTVRDVTTTLESIHENNSEHMRIWQDRGHFRFVILLDWNSCVDALKSHSYLALLRDAIFKWDAKSTLSNKPLILDGGYEAFLLYYPSYTTNPTFKRQQAIEDAPVVTNFMYPDIIQVQAQEKAKEDEFMLLQMNEAKVNRRLDEIDRENRVAKLQANTSSVGKIDPVVPDRKLKPIVDSNIDSSILPATINATKPLIPDRSTKPAVFLSASSDDQPMVNHEEALQEIQPIEITPQKDTFAEETEIRTLNLEINAVPKKGIIPSSLNVTQLSERMTNEARFAKDSLSVFPSNAAVTFGAKGGAKPRTSVSSDIQSDKSSAVGMIGQLPSGWEKLLHPETGRYYYVDHINKTTHWTPPDDIFQSTVGAGILQTLPKKNSFLTSVGKVSKAPLKDAASVSHSNSGIGLKRSSSHPNLAQIGANIDDDINLVVDRHTKPVGPAEVQFHDKTNTNNNTAGCLSDFTARKLRSLEPSYGSTHRGLTGLRNLGNTCYMNSVIQALNNTPVLVTYFLNGDFQSDVNENNPLGHGGRVAMEFAVLIEALWSGSYTAVSPRDFKNIVSQCAPMFAGHQQQDSQEFLLFLMDSLHEDLNKVKQRVALTTTMDSAEESRLADWQRAKLCWEQHKLRNESLIVELFQGQFKSSIRCIHCNKTSTTFDAFMYLSLPLPNKSHCDLRSCLDLFQREERMSGSSQWYCPQCQCDRDAIKKIVIWRLPPYLLIHLKRFSCSGSWRQKLNTSVDFPHELTDLCHFVDGNKNSSVYRLYAVSNHYGSMEGGHYTAFCRNPQNKRWYKFDDELVSEIRSCDTHTSAAYILFYSRLHVDEKFSVANK